MLEYLKENDLPEDSKVTKQLFSDILKDSHSKMLVKIDKGLPVLFSKNRIDSKLLDTNYPKYQKDLQKMTLTKKLLKKHKKTRKNK